MKQKINYDRLYYVLVFKNWKHNPKINKIGNIILILKKKSRN